VSFFDIPVTLLAALPGIAGVISGNPVQLCVACPLSTLVAMPDLAEDPSLFEHLANLDRGVVDSVLDPGSFVAPPPLMDKLFIPDGRRWRQTFQSDASSYLIPDALGDGKLEELDRGLVQEPERSDRRRQLRAVLANHPTRPISSNAISRWLISAWLVLLMFAGAAVAALAFHDRLSAVIVLVEDRLK
jgi:hypothetical protein